DGPSAQTDEIIKQKQRNDARIRCMKNLSKSRDVGWVIELGPAVIVLPRAPLASFTLMINSYRLVRPSDMDCRYCICTHQVGLESPTCKSAHFAHQDDQD